MRGHLDSQEIVRAIPPLQNWHVPNDLDREIWESDETLHVVNIKRSLIVPIALENTGTSSYVLFSACKSNETAKEASKQGHFTKALLDLLTDLGPNNLDNMSCSQIIDHLRKRISVNL